MADASRPDPMDRAAVMVGSAGKGVCPDDDESGTANCLAEAAGIPQRRPRGLDRFWLASRNG